MVILFDKFVIWFISKEEQYFICNFSKFGKLYKKLSENFDTLSISKFFALGKIISLSKYLFISSIFDIFIFIKLFEFSLSILLSTNFFDLNLLSLSLSLSLPWVKLHLFILVSHLFWPIFINKFWSLQIFEINSFIFIEILLLFKAFKKLNFSKSIFKNTQLLIILLNSSDKNSWIGFSLSNILDISKKFVKIWIFSLIDSNILLCKDIILSNNLR